MESYSIFCYNASDYVKEIAKVGTNSDILLYHRKDEDIIMTFIEPVKYPEKVSSLTDSIYPSDIAIVKVSTINKEIVKIINVFTDFINPHGCQDAVIQPIYEF